MALEHAHISADIGVVILTGNGPSPKDGGWAFCSGGDQRIRGKDGYKYEGTDGNGTGEQNKVNLARLLMAEEHRNNTFDSTDLLRAGAGGGAATTMATGYRYAEMGYRHLRDLTNSIENSVNEVLA